jgi:large subunit ribosomal protein L18
MSKDSLAHKQFQAAQRRQRARRRLYGSSGQPRLSVHISQKHISAQIIDDDNGRTLAYVTTVGRPLKGTMTNKAILVGEEIAKRAKKVKVSQVSFDRGSRQYHGRIKALAEAARNGGLEF